MAKKLTPLDIAECAPLPSVAATLVRLRQKQSLQSLVVTSCNQGEGKTTVALQLARAAAIEGALSVLLIDANPAHPELTELFGYRPTPGLADILDGQATADEVVCATSIKGLDLVPFGGLTPGRVSRYAPDNLSGALAELRAVGGTRYDLMILDGPSSYGELDLTVSAAVLDGVVLVIECERTRWEVVRNYQDRLREGKANLLGAVMNKRRYYIPKSLYV
ncbi:MAG: tyrosine-protein kinase family protein [Sphingobacteriia bacterium]|nr:tyrosine-protein kinase family protein [Sphingobacteriia bacterium]NCC40616.1 tyrosine-protein kinase family protein [Gammaproteobacteria bacterium]